METKELAIKLNLDTQDAVSKVSKLTKAIDKKDLQDVNAKFNALNEKINSGVLSTKELKKAIKDYKDIAISAGQNSVIGEAALKRAGELKDKMIDIDAQINVMATDGAKMNAALTISGTAIQGYQAFIGISQLAGGENKKLMETMSKMIILQQTFDGIQKLSEQFRSGSVLTTYAMATAYKVLGVSTQTASSATKGFAKALAATGIGAIIVAIGLLIANFKDIVNWVKNLTNKISNFAQNIPILKQAVEGLKVVFNAIGKAIQYVKELFGGLSEAQERYFDNFEKNKEKFDEFSEKVERLYNKDIALSKAHGKDTYELEQQKAKQLENILQKKLKIYKDYLTQLEDNQSDEYKDAVKVIKETQNKIEDLNLEHQVREIERRKQQQDDYNRYLAEKRKQDEEFFNSIKQLNSKQLEAATEFDNNMQERIANMPSISEHLTEETAKSKEELDKWVEQYENYGSSVKEAYLGIMNSAASGMGSVFEALANAQERGSKKYKQFALLGIITSQAQSIANAVVAASKAARDIVYDPTGILRISVYFSTFASIATGVITSIMQAKRILGESSGGSVVSSPPSHGGGVTPANGGGGSPEAQNPNEYANKQNVKVFITETDINKAVENNMYKKIISVI